MKRWEVLVYILNAGCALIALVCGLIAGYCIGFNATCPSHEELYDCNNHLRYIHQCEH